MQSYTKEDLQRCEQLLDEACNEILKQQTIIDQLTELDGLGPACEALEAAMEEAVLYSEERAFILEALSKSGRVS